MPQVKIKPYEKSIIPVSKDTGVPYTELNLKDRKKLTRITAKSCQKAKKPVKSKILDTFISQTGYERKYAVHLPANEGTMKRVSKNLKAQVSRKSRK
ncbi:MAG: hypothetical protein LBC27_10295, partial [Spirochaetaceae bacterium]|nr:hypothetical protein [Spirochaetaceae bacterium]